MNCRVAKIAVSSTAAGTPFSGNVQRHLCKGVRLARRRDAHKAKC